MLLLLNDDCLLHIFQLLDIPEQLNLIETCDRFRFLIIDEVWCRKYRQVHTQMKNLNSLSLSEYKKFFKYNANNIQKLHIEDTKHYAFTSYLNRFTDRPDYSFYFSLNLGNLKELHCKDQRLHDGYVQMLSKYCPNLEILHIESHHVTEMYMEQFQMLREFNLGGRHCVVPRKPYVETALEAAPCVR